MKKYLITLVMACLAPFAVADTIAFISDPSIGVLLLEDEKCSDNENLKAIMVDVDSERFEGCYVLHETNIYILWDDGDKDIIPLEYFELAPKNKSS